MKVYLATPYSHPNPAVSQARFEAINRVAACIINEGHVVYSPISHTHPIAMTGLLPEEAEGTCGENWEFWEEQDMPFLDWCDELWVYMADGWEESTGVDQEITMILAAEKPVRYISESDY